MIVKLNDWSPKFFHQKGWIGSKFHSKINNGAMRWKKRNQTETHLNSQIQGQGQPSAALNQQASSSEYSKPMTAPSKTRSKGEIVEKMEKIGAGNGKWEQAPMLSESKYSNFRTSVSNRKQLLYIKPYTRYQSQHLSIDQKKNQIYRQINNPDVGVFIDNYKNNSSKIIQYLTEYNDPYLEGTARNKRKVRSSNMAQHRVSLNVLREKLKRKCQPSQYSKKMNALNSQ